VIGLEVALLAYVPGLGLVIAEAGRSPCEGKGASEGKRAEAVIIVNVDPSRQISPVQIDLFDLVIARMDNGITESAMASF